MKKKLLPLILLVATMSSCMKDEIISEEIEQDQADLVTINVAAGTTKGADVTTTSLENSSGVKLHIQDAGTISDAYEFTASNSDWNQTSSTPLKWVDITFPAYFHSLHDGTAQSVTLSDSSSSTTYTVADESASSDHNDLVYHSSKLSSTPIGGTITVFHKHALSKISLYAATGGNKLYIARVNLVNIDPDGTITISPVSASEITTANGVDWKNSGTSDANYNYYYIANNAASALTSTTDGSTIINSDSKAPLMIIPQMTTGVTSADLASYQDSAPGSYIEVIYYLTDVDDNALVGYSSVSARSDASDYIDADQSKTLYVMGAFALGYTFEPNKQYDITLGLGKTNSTGGMLVVDYYVDKNGDPISLTKVDDEGCTEPEIPEIDPGDDILPDSDDNIDIIVTASDWEDGGSTSLN